MRAFRTFMGVLLIILGIVAIILLFTSVTAGMTMFWRVAHFIAGAAMIIAAVPLVRNTAVSDMEQYDATRTTNYDTTRL